MSAVMIPIDVETQSWLTKRAVAQGVAVEQVAGEVLRQAARRPTIHEVFADVHAEFKASGMTDEELGELVEQALLEVRAENP